MAASSDAFRTDVEIDAPIDSLRHSHERIVDTLQALAKLPQLAEQMRRARELAQAVAQVFDGPVLQHHADEERHLFPAVVASARPGAEAEKAQALAQQLTAQHRAMEQAWKAVARPVRAIAGGEPAALPEEAVARLVLDYADHARFEETVYLPFAEEVLSRDRNHMAAVGVSLHLSHVKGVPGYI